MNARLRPIRGAVILKNGQDKVALTADSAGTVNKESAKYGITRGASYYEGGKRLWYASQP